MKVNAKCNNFSGCLVAYRGEKIELDEGAPLVCPECGKPLTEATGGSGGAIKIAAIAVGVLVVAAGGFVAMKAIRGGGKTTPPTVVDSGGGDVSGESPKGSGESTPPVTPTPPEDTPPIPPVEEPPVADTKPLPPARVDNKQVTRTIKNEVIDRIDSIPDLSKEKKDKLAISVEKARDMRRILIVPFGSGQASLAATQKNEVKAILDSAEVMKFRDDLTAVFVILGFADSQGDDQKNLTISTARGKSVKEFLVKECGVKNVAHSIGMGSSKLIDDDKLEKNRVAEIWAVLP